ncbi:L-lysine 6-monooxygenase (NADPH-requiring)-domain-containing protein [Myxozyma melibiosi]|uniref:L-ornithine N(5)-monooxygenase [NAD(P)H] n=1 Tax=Myxozyma melibiosi TaxID=54550 RepID=A0ABR1EYU5_9ASCO
MASHDSSLSSTSSSSLTSPVSSPTLSSNQERDLCDGSLEHPYDLICIGFGPSALAIAVALMDTSPEALSKVLFIEKQQRFGWHGGMLIPAARMQISFIKDFATQRDPTSRFTFLNFLHSKDRLIDFINQSTFYPLREEYQEYMSWCADHFSNQVAYGEYSQSVTPVDGPNGDHGKSEEPIKLLRVSSAVNDQGGNRDRYARNVIVCTGGQPKVPGFFPKISRGPITSTGGRSGALSEDSDNSLNSLMFHSSSFMYVMPRLVAHANKGPIRIAVIGAGQSAAEIAMHLISNLPESSAVDMIFSSRALRPADDTPFVNEIFNPSAVDEIYALPQSVRSKVIQEDKGTNYSVVRSELIDRLYDELYAQKLPGHSARLAILNSRRVSDASVLDGKRVRLEIVDNLFADFKRDQELQTEIKEYDYVIAATGYDRVSESGALLSSLKQYVKLMDENEPAVDRGYRLKLDREKIEASVWVQGLCEQSHGLSDTLLSILALRGKEIVDQLFKSDLETSFRKL